MYFSSRSPGILVVTMGLVCPHRNGPLQAAQGIEVGHIFKLGTKRILSDFLPD